MKYFYNTAAFASDDSQLLIGGGSLLPEVSLYNPDSSGSFKTTTRKSDISMNPSVQSNVEPMKNLTEVSGVRDLQSISADLNITPSDRTIVESVDEDKKVELSYTRYNVRNKCLFPNRETVK